MVAWPSCPPAATSTLIPRSASTGPQDVDAVASPGTFDARLPRRLRGPRRQRSQSLALEPTLTPRRRPTARRSPTGPASTCTWPRATATARASGRSRADDLAGSAASPSITAPTATRPLVINVDGDGAPVVLDTPGHGRRRGPGRTSLWNVVDARPSWSASPALPGSLLAPAAAGRDRRRRAGPGDRRHGRRRPPAPSARTPFAAELPKTADPTPTTDPPTSRPGPTPASGPGRRSDARRSCRRPRATTPSSPSRSAATGVSTSAVSPPGRRDPPALRRHVGPDHAGAPTRSPPASPTSTATAPSSCRTRRPTAPTATGASGSCGRARRPAGSG